jgi:hypothetical protein
MNTDPLEVLYNALADASNALDDVTDDCISIDTITYRKSIDTHIDAALSELRSWREALEVTE